MKSDVGREERRLRRVFRHALWVAFAAPAVAIPFACAPGPNSSDTTTSGTTSSANDGSGGSGGAATSTVSTSTSSGSPTSSSITSTGSGPADAGPDFDSAACAPVGITPDPPDTCGNYVRFPCGLPPSIPPADDCFLYLSDCAKVCPGNYFNCHAVDTNCSDGGMLIDDPQGGVTIDCSTCPNGLGRIPAGLEPARTRRAPSAIGDYFAAATHLEAASVHAFHQLHDDLAAHRAPAPLLRACRTSAREEARHARVMGRLARRFGGSAPRPRVQAPPRRSLAAIAMENAVEGCVRETYGALFVGFQAARAANVDVAQAMQGIARDETRHAALSWAVGRWAWQKLDEAERAEVIAACREAIAQLRREADEAVDGDLGACAGLPSPAERHAMLATLEAKLWGAFCDGAASGPKPRRPSGAITATVTAAAA